MTLTAYVLIQNFKKAAKIIKGIPGGIFNLTNQPLMGHGGGVYLIVTYKSTLTNELRCILQEQSSTPVSMTLFLFDKVPLIVEEKLSVTIKYISKAAHLSTIHKPLFDKQLTLTVLRHKAFDPKTVSILLGQVCDLSVRPYCNVRAYLIVKARDISLLANFNIKLVS